MSVLESGSTLGRYTLLLPVGQGGQAAVWAASFAGLAGFEKTVALKTLLPACDGEDAHIERFTDEALLATRLRHPNVVEVLDFGEEDGVLYIVMPWIDGEPVSAIIDAASKEDGIPFGVTANLIGQACRGLHAAHELESASGQPLGLVHRDVSPENILVTRDGTAKIADFGVATVRGELGCVTGETDLGRARGKIWYMAPEELRGEAVDRRADLFALGVVLYRMTTGRHPFGSGNGRESMRRLLAGAEPIPPTSFLPAYPPALERVVLRALSDSPDERQATARELRQELFRAIAPASDDDVASFLAELFSGRRLERDERLRLAHESLAAGKGVADRGSDDAATAERSSIRHSADRGARPAGWLAVGAGAVTLVAFASSAVLGRGAGGDASPAFVPKADVAAAEPHAETATDERSAPASEPQSSPPPPGDVTLRAVLSSRDVTEPEQALTDATEERAIDLSPVREVGF